MAQNNVTLYGNGVQRRFILPTNLAVGVFPQSEAQLGPWTLQDGNQLVFNDPVPFGVQFSVDYEDGNTYGGSGSGGGLSPEQLDALVTDAEAAALAGNVLPAGVVMEFPVGRVAPGYSIVSGSPEVAPLGGHIQVPVGSLAVTGSTSALAAASSPLRNTIYSIGATSGTLVRRDTVNNTALGTATIPTSRWRIGALVDFDDNNLWIGGLVNTSYHGVNESLVLNLDTMTFSSAVAPQVLISGQNYVGGDGTAVRLPGSRAFWLPASLRLVASSASDMFNTGGYACVYNGLTNTVQWKQLAGFPSNWVWTDQRSPAMALLPDGKILVLEGRTTTTAGRRYVIIDWDAGTATVGSSVSLGNLQTLAYAAIGNAVGATLMTPSGQLHTYTQATDSFSTATPRWGGAGQTIAAGGPLYGRLLPFSNTNPDAYALTYNLSASALGVDYVFSVLNRFGTVKASKN